MKAITSIGIIMLISSTLAIQQLKCGTGSGSHESVVVSTPIHETIAMGSISQPASHIAVISSTDTQYAEECHVYEEHHEVYEEESYVIYNEVQQGGGCKPAKPLGPLFKETLEKIVLRLIEIKDKNGNDALERLYKQSKSFDAIITIDFTKNEALSKICNSCRINSKGIATCTRMMCKPDLSTVEGYVLSILGNSKRKYSKYPQKMGKEFKVKGKKGGWLKFKIIDEVVKRESPFATFKITKASDKQQNQILKKLKKAPKINIWQKPWRAEIVGIQETCVIRKGDANRYFQESKGGISTGQNSLLRTYILELLESNGFKFTKLKTMTPKVNGKFNGKKEWIKLKRL